MLRLIIVEGSFLSVCLAVFILKSLSTTLTNKGPENIVNLEAERIYEAGDRKGCREMMSLAHGMTMVLINSTHLFYLPKTYIRKANKISQEVTRKAVNKFIRYKIK